LDGVDLFQLTVGNFQLDWSLEYNRDEFSKKRNKESPFRYVSRCRRCLCISCSRSDNNQRGSHRTTESIKQLINFKSDVQQSTHRLLSIRAPALSTIVERIRQRRTFNRAELSGAIALGASPTPRAN
jgi:hypothetical protein